MRELTVIRDAAEALKEASKHKVSGKNQVDYQVRYALAQQVKLFRVPSNYSTHAAFFLPVCSKPPSHHNEIPIAKLNTEYQKLAKKKYDVLFTCSFLTDNKVMSKVALMLNEVVVKMLWSSNVDGEAILANIGLDCIKVCNCDIASGSPTTISRTQ